MKIEPGKYCPIIKEDCIMHKCAWFTSVRGVDVNTGKEVDEWGCAVAWLPVLLINTANEARKTTVATESFRNEMVRQNDESSGIIPIEQKQTERLQQ